MLIITKAQLERLDAVHLDRFKARVIDHLRELFPALVGRPAEEFDREIDAGIAEARSRGVISERDIARYLDLRAKLGVGFLADPEHEWIAAILADPLRVPDTHLDAIFADLAARIPRCAPIVAWWRENG